MITFLLMQDCLASFFFENSFGVQTNPMFDDEEDETEQEQKKIGAFFARQQAEKKSKSDQADEMPANDQLQIMKNVAFVLSGFQNPLRAELRTKATAMGATYHDEWNKKCTHLVCAFPNTPKFAQVEQSGKGIIVNKQWILDCHKQNQLIPEKFFQLKESKKRKSKNEDEPTGSKDIKCKTPVKKKSANTNDDQSKAVQFDELPDFFHGIHFYVSYGDYDDNTLLAVTRVILAYDGILETRVNADVKYVITNRLWNQDFEKISKSNPNVQFLNLDWLQDCHDANQFVAVEPYLTVR